MTTLNNNNSGKTICLNMIVKNESHVIEGTLLNLWSYIHFDYWVICDTGSTDQTMDIIRAFFKERNVPGELLQHEWRDFGHNRTCALQAAFGKSDYIWIFDADDRIIGDFPPEMLHAHSRGFLTADQYFVPIGNVYVYSRNMLVSNKRQWMYEGVLHETIQSAEPTHVQQLLQHGGKLQSQITPNSNYYIESNRTGARNLNPDKYYLDALTLKRGYEDILAALPSITDVSKYNHQRSLADRYAFYCAQSYKDAGSAYINDAIEWYTRVVRDLNNWNQEKYYSCLTLGYLYQNKEVEASARAETMENARNFKQQKLQWWLESFRFDPERIEGVANVMEVFRREGNHYYHTLCNALYERIKDYQEVYLRNFTANNKLFVDTTKWTTYTIEFQNSVSAYYTGNFSSGWEACRRILVTAASPASKHNISAEHIHLTLHNMYHYCNVMKVTEHAIATFGASDAAAGHAIITQLFLSVNLLSRQRIDTLLREVATQPGIHGQTREAIDHKLRQELQTIFKLWAHLHSQINNTLLKNNMTVGDNNILTYYETKFAATTIAV